MKTHGMTNHLLYRIYDTMVQRCYNPKNNRYSSYGARGIVVCDEWRADRTRFFAWAFANGYRPGLSIDRIDSNLEYRPENCRWLTRSEHARLGNPSTNRYITWNGETRTLKAWSQTLGHNYWSIKTRLARGWSVERAFTQPYQQQSRS